MKTLIAGFGNVLLRDDGFGVEVVRQLFTQPLPAGTDVIEVGIGGLNFVLRLIDGYDRTVVVDAVGRGERPGTVYVFVPEESDRLEPDPAAVDPHLTEPGRAFSLARSLNLLPSTVMVIGCEPATVELGVGLSEPVRAAVDTAVRKVIEIVNAD